MYVCGEASEVGEVETESEHEGVMDLRSEGCLGG